MCALSSLKFGYKRPVKCCLWKKNQFPAELELHVRSHLPSTRSANWARASRLVSTIFAELQWRVFPKKVRLGRRAVFEDGWRIHQAVHDSIVQRSGESK